MTVTSSAARVLALDVGERRLGVAISDPAGRVATPLVTLQRGTVAGDAAALSALARERGADRLVVGLPLSLSGRAGPAANAVRQYVAALTPRLDGLAVELTDERLSTVQAERALASGGTRRRRRRAVVDQVAASVFLQGWLDRNRVAER